MIDKKKLYNIIMEDVAKIVKKHLNEEYQITLTHDGKEGFQNMQKWVFAMNELNKTGEVVIHIVIDYNKTLTALVTKTDRNTVSVDVEGLNKEYASVNDAFVALKSHAENFKK